MGGFVEKVVGPGFQGAISEMDVPLVNGSSGTVYDTYNLDEKFAAGAGLSGCIFVADTSNIQNGSPDGIAVVKSNEGRLLHFFV